MPKSFYTDVSLNKNQLLAVRIENVAVYPTGPFLGQVVYYTPDNTFRGWNGTTWVDLSQVVNAATIVRGEISNANTNPSFPANPTTGDTYFITTSAGTVGGLPVEVGDQLVRSASSWFVLQANLQAASQTLAGFVRLATAAEVIAGTDATTGVSPATLANFLANYGYTRKYRTVITSLAANAATTVTHGLGLLNPEDFHISFTQGGVPIELTYAPATVNTLTVTSNQTLGNVTVVVIG